MEMSLYDYTGLVKRLVTDAQQRLYGIAPNSISWQSIGDALQDAADAAKEVARRIKEGEVR